MAASSPILPSPAPLPRGPVLPIDVRQPVLRRGSAPAQRELPLRRLP